MLALSPQFFRKKKEMSESTDLPDFHEMTLDEIVDWRVAQSAEVDRLKASIRASNEEYALKLHSQNLALRLASSGVDPKIITPDMVTVYMQGQQGGLSEAEESEPQE